MEQIHMNLPEESLQLEHEGAVTQSTEGQETSAEVLEGVGVERVESANLVEGEEGIDSAEVVEGGGGEEETVVGIVSLEGGEELAHVEGVEGAVGEEGEEVEGLEGEAVEGEGLVGVESGGIVEGEGLEGTEELEGAVGIEGAEGLEETEALEGAEALEGVEGLEGSVGLEGTEGMETHEAIEGAEGMVAEGAEGIEGDEGIEGTEGMEGEEGLEGHEGMVGEEGAVGVPDDGNLGLLGEGEQQLENPQESVDQIPQEEPGHLPEGAHAADLGVMFQGEEGHSAEDAALLQDQYHEGLDAKANISDENTGISDMPNVPLGELQQSALPSNIKQELGNEEAESAANDDLSTLANAALTCDQATNGVKSEDSAKKEPVWCDVGIIKNNTSCYVNSYFEPPFSHDQEHEFITADNLPDFSNCFKIDLEPGTAYKFRVAAVNSCGRGPWSEVSAFKTCLPGFPGAPSSIKISKSAEGAHLSWEPPSSPAGNIIEYSVCLAVRNSNQTQTDPNKAQQLAFVRVYSGPQNQTIVPNASLAAAHIDTTSKPAIIFRIAAKNEKGFGPATQVRWLQDVIASPGGGVKPLQKKEPINSNPPAKRLKTEDF